METWKDTDRWKFGQKEMQTETWTNRWENRQTDI
jgi:hypothetical protein